MSRNKVLHIGAVFVFSFLVYINTFQNQFTYDDFPTILENRAVTESDVTGVLLGSRPMRQLTFMIDYELFGRNPMGYHVENALLHAIISILLYRFLLLLSFSTSVALSSSIVFSAHPVHVEAVAGIANRKELLSMLFILISSICYIKAVSLRFRRTTNLLASLAFYIIAVLSKQTAAFLPFILVVYDYLFIERKERVLARLAIPISLLIILLSLYSRGFPDIERPYAANVTIKEAILTAISVFPLDLRYLAIPVQLSADHTIMIISGASLPLMLGLSTIAGYIIISLVVLRYDRMTFFFLAWIVTFLIPTSNLIPGTSYFFAERYLYIPSAGFSAILGRLFDFTRPKKVLLIPMFLIILAFSYLTVLRNTVWKGEGTLWEDTVRKSPRSVFAHNNLGNVYSLKGDYERAESEYEVTLRLNPVHPESLYNLGNIYYNTGRLDMARERYKSFLKVWKGDKRIGMAIKDRVRSLEARKD